MARAGAEARRDGIPLAPGPPPVDPDRVDPDRRPASVPPRPQLPGHGPGTGDVVGEHRLERALGRGGMATVFVGRHLGSGALHAVKLQTLGGKPERLERFAREARALAKVDRHPGVVRVHAHGVTPAGQAWLALELVEGIDLGQALERGPLEPARALRLARGVASALAHVHAQGVTHRDLKPGNVLLRSDDAPALADFGLALDLEEERLTQTKQLLGTPAYMAPEQLACQRDLVGPATDVFALGVLLHELLTGERPWEGDSALELAIAQLEVEPRLPSALRGGLPAGVDDLVHACLAVDPAARPTAAALEAAIARVERGEPAGLARGPRRRRRRRLGPAAAVVAALCVPLGVGAGVALATQVLRSARPVSAGGAEAVAEGQALRELARAVRLGPALGEPAALESARAALARRLDDARGAGSAPGAPTETGPDDDLARARAVGEAALAAARGLAWDGPGLTEADAALVAAAREARAPGAGGGAAARIDALHRALRARGALAQVVAAELQLQAAHAALAGGDATRALAREARPTEPLLVEVAARLEARAHVARAVARAAALDAAGVEAAALAARRASPRVADAGTAEVVEAALAAAPPGNLARAELLASTLLALRRAGGRDFGTAAALVLQGAAGRALDAREVERAVELLETALHADPELPIPSSVVLPLVIVLHKRLSDGDLQGAYALALLCVRAGEDPSMVISVRDMARLGDAGLIGAAVTVHPDDPAALYWLADWLVDVDPRDPPRRTENLTRAVDVAARVAAARLPLVVRSEARVLELRARIYLGQPDAEARVDALRAAGFPMVHLLDKALALRHQADGRHLEALTCFDRALAGLGDLVARTREGALPPGAREVREGPTATAQLRIGRLDVLLALGRLAEARLALAELEAMDRPPPLDQRARLLFAEGRPADALVQAEAALAREPARVDLLELRARLLRALGDPRAAEAEAQLKPEGAGR
jgi:hypothetical protein